MPEQPDPRVLRRIESWQERAYGELAVALGLGWQPDAAFRQLNPPPGNDASDAVEFVRSFVADDVGTDWSELKRGIEGATELHFPSADRRFERASSYVPASHYLAMSVASPVWAEVGNLYLTPVVATLPTLGMTPLTRVYPRTGSAVILLQHGVLDYLMHVASVAASITPPEWFLFQRGRHAETLTRPAAPLAMLRAKVLLEDVITAYLLAGSPSGVEDLYVAGQLRQNRMEIFQAACLFLLGHEVAHVSTRYFVSPVSGMGESHQRELACDRLGALATMSQWDAIRLPPDVAALGCVTALLGIEAMESSVARLSGGAQPRTNATHPPIEDRITALSDFVSVALATWLPDPDEFLGHLRRLIAVFRALVDAVLPVLDELRESGRRPSPVWGVDRTTNLEVGS